MPAVLLSCWVNIVITVEGTKIDAKGFNLDIHSFPISASRRSPLLTGTGFVVLPFKLYKH